jgi:hypothetical protein
MNKTWDLISGVMMLLGGLYTLKTRRQVDRRTVDFRYDYWRRLGDRLPTWWPVHPAKLRHEDLERSIPKENLLTAIALLLGGMFVLGRSFWYK